MAKLSLFCIPQLVFFDHAISGQPTVLRHRPRHVPTIRLGRHGPNTNRVMSYLGVPWAGPNGHAVGRALGLMAIYTPSHPSSCLTNPEGGERAPHPCFPEPVSGSPPAFILIFESLKKMG